MATMIELDEALVADAIRVTGQENGKAALEELVRRHVRAMEQRQAIENLHGVGWDGPSLDELRAHRLDPG